MGYKLLGYVVWNGGKWYLRRRYPGAGRKLKITGVVVLTAGGAVAVAGARRRIGTD